MEKVYQEFERTKNSGRTIFFGILSKIIMLLLPFATRTIIIYRLGIEYAGLNSLFTSILSILSISELGLNSAITFCLYEPVSKKDYVKINALLNFLRKMYLLVGGFILLIGLILIPFLNHFINGEVPKDVNIYVLYILYLLSTVISYFSFAYKNTLFNVYQRGDVEHKILSITEIVKCGLQIVLLLIFSNYYVITGCLLFSIILNTIIVAITSKKMFPMLKPEGRIDKETGKIIARKVGALASHSVLTRVVSSIDSIVISSFIGLAAIGIYGNYIYIYTAILGFVLIIISSIRPAVANYLITKNQEQSKKMYKMISRLFRWLIVFCTASLLCLYQPFIQMWVGSENLLDMPIVVIISSFFAINCFSQFYSSFVSIKGLWNKTLPFVIAGSILNLIIDFVLVRYIGILGIVFGTLAYNLVVYPSELYVSFKYVLKFNHKQYVATIMKDFLSVSIISCLIYFVCSFVVAEGIIGLFVKLLFCILLSLLFMLVFTKDDYYNIALKYTKSLFNGKTNFTNKTK